MKELHHLRCRFHRTIHDHEDSGSLKWLIPNEYVTKGKDIENVVGQMKILKTYKHCPKIPILTKCGPIIKQGLKISKDLCFMLWDKDEVSIDVTSPAVNVEEGTLAKKMKNRTENKKCKVNGNKVPKTEKRRIVKKWKSHKYNSRVAKGKKKSGSKEI
ncbi:hypothetical protein ACH5RR_021671 [Cinchona calisaya]|uniref:Uncharacterized protein n=1 Tax=Cinchona calisaya TaxID=153742 RepID=A0ABD2ZKX2_9GENT